MKYLKLSFLLIATLSCFLIVAQQAPALKQTKDIAIVGATAHIGNGDVIKNVLIIIKDGKISTIADATLAKVDLLNMDVIKADGKHVYPGFIVPNSTLGLVEIPAVKASNDVNEMGNFNPNIRSLIAYNAESKVVESTRPNGVLLGQITPIGGRISGTSSIVQFDAWNWEDAAVKVDDGIHINWPDSYTIGRQWLGEDPGLKPNDKYSKQVTELENYFSESKAYQKGNSQVKNLKFQSLEGLFDGSKRLYIHVDDEKGILDVINFCIKNSITYAAVVGGHEAYKVASTLKENNIPVVLHRVHSLPALDDEDYDLPYKMAKLLVDAGVLVALESSGALGERINTRNLPFFAGTTAAYGLTKEQALQLITLNTAKILGIDSDYGSLTEGKSATLFISEGDALDMSTNQITHAFIDGRLISLETHQTELWKRYSKKYESN